MSMPEAAPPVDNAAARLAQLHLLPSRLTETVGVHVDSLLFRGLPSFIPRIRPAHLLHTASPVGLPRTGVYFATSLLAQL